MHLHNAHAILSDIESFHSKLSLHLLHLASFNTAEAVVWAGWTLPIKGLLRWGSKESSDDFGYLAGFRLFAMLATAFYQFR